MNSVLKILKQPLRAVSPETVVHTISNKISKIFEKHPRRNPFPPADILRAAPTGFPQVYLKRMTILR